MKRIHTLPGRLAIASAAALLMAAQPAFADGVPDGRYTIQSAYSGKCLDIAGASKADGGNLQQYLCNNTGAQKFDVRQISTGSFRLLNVNSGKAIDVASLSTVDGANVQQWTSNGNGAQRFAIKVTNDQTQFTIVNQNSGKCLDVADWSTNDGGNIQQWACAGSQNQRFTFTKADGGVVVPPTNPAEGLSGAAKKDIAMQLVSSAENSSLNWKAQYQYIQDINDGRGYTAGIIGFCSGTGDMLELVQAYTAAKPGNVLSKYLQALRNVNGTSSHAGLDPNFQADWRTAAQDPIFQQSQNAERDRSYFNPSVAQAKADGLRTLGQFIYYDAIVMHGPGENGVSFGGIRKAALRVALPPSQGGDETRYLNAFLDARVAAMKTEEAHSDVSRVETAQRVFLRNGNLDLNTPLNWKVYGDSFNIP